MKENILSDGKRLRIISMSSTDLLNQVEKLRGTSSLLLLELTERNKEISDKIPEYKKDFYDIQQKSIVDIYHIFCGIERACSALKVKLENFGADE